MCDQRENKSLVGEEIGNEGCQESKYFSPIDAMRKYK